MTNLNGIAFTTHSESTRTDYSILFRHWRERDLAKRIGIAFGRVGDDPCTRQESLPGTLSAERMEVPGTLYGNIDATENPGDGFAFDPGKEDASHDPMINWALGPLPLAPPCAIWIRKSQRPYERFLKSFEDHVHDVAEQFITDAAEVEHARITLAQLPQGVSHDERPFAWTSVSSAIPSEGCEPLQHAGDRHAAPARPLGGKRFNSPRYVNLSDRSKEERH